MPQVQLTPQQLIMFIDDHRASNARALDRHQ